MNEEDLDPLEAIDADTPRNQPKPTLFVCNQDQHGNPHTHALTLKWTPRYAYHNQGAICLADRKQVNPHLPPHVLDLKRSLHGPITNRNEELDLPNAFPQLCPQPNPNGATHCWGGVGYASSVSFTNLDLAVRYLRIYFRLSVCLDNFPPLANDEGLAEIGDYDPAAAG
jgi:hypothetical protein